MSIELAFNTHYSLVRGWLGGKWWLHAQWGWFELQIEFGRSVSGE